MSNSNNPLNDGQINFSVSEGLYVILSQMMLGNSVRIGYRNTEKETVSRVFTTDEGYEDLLLYYINRCRDVLRFNKKFKRRITVNFFQKGKPGTTQHFHVLFSSNEEFFEELQKSLKILSTQDKVDTTDVSNLLQSLSAIAAC